MAEAAQILGLSERQLRRFVREGFLDRAASPEKLRNGEPRFGFQDLVLLRSAKQLLAARVSPLRIRRALSALRARLPEGRPLSGVRVAVEGEELVVRDVEGVWAPESGQAIFDFSVASEHVTPVSPIEGAMYPDPIADFDDSSDIEAALLPVGVVADVLDPADKSVEMRCSDWMDLAEAFDEDRRPLQARDALRRALEVDPFETEARRRLAKLLEQEGLWERAEAHYRMARQHRSDDPDLAVDHGRALAHLGQSVAALDAFEVAKALDPKLKDAYLGAAEIHERLGNFQAAQQLLQEARPLAEPSLTLERIREPSDVASDDHPTQRPSR